MKTLSDSSARVFAPDSGHSSKLQSYSAAPTSVRLAGHVSMVQYYPKISCYSAVLSMQSSLPDTHLPHCLPISESEDGLRGETTGTSQLVSAKFQLKNECQFGDHMLMVGDEPILGSWNPSDAVALDWSEGHLWTSVLELPVEKIIRYKFLLKKSSGEILWQPGPDRIFLPWETTNVIIVDEDWEDEEAQLITEEKPNIYENSECAGTELVDPSVTGPPISDDNVTAPGSEANSQAGDSSQETDTTKLSPTVENGTLKGRSPEMNKQKKVSARKGNKKEASREDNSSNGAEEKGSLVIEDEGPVLVPGLTLVVKF